MTQILDEIRNSFGEYRAEVAKFSTRIDALEGRQKQMMAEAVVAGMTGALVPQNIVEAKNDFTQFLRGKIQASSKGTVPADGGLAVPKEIDDIISNQLISINPMRRLARVVKVSTPDYHSLIGLRGAASGWVGETDARTETATPTIGDIAPTFGTVYAYPFATEEILNDAHFNLEQWLQVNVTDEINYQEALAFVSGNGTKKPTGFLNSPTPVTTADASRAFGTLQYVAGGNASTMPTSVDTLIDVVHALASPYRQGAAWQANSKTIAVIRKYKDTANQYLWQPSNQAGQPDLFLGYPMIINENMPDIAANAFPVAFGNWSRGYLIADLVDTRMTRDEVTTPGYVKFYVRRRVGGKLADSNAIKLLKIAAS